MNGITINIDPVLLRLGHFEIRWYSLFIFLAVVVAVLISRREFARRGIGADEVLGILPWMLIGGLVGARLFHVIDRWDYYALNPLQIVQLQQGGLAIWGALAGGSLGVIIYARVKRIALGRLADALVPGVIIGQIIGRFGCIVNGDAYGGIADLPWAFIYVHPGAMIPSSLAGLPTHPYPVYEIFWNGLALLALTRFTYNTVGTRFLTYVALYGLGRFILTFVRQEKVWFWGLQEAQVLALIMVVGAGSVLVYRFFSQKRRAQLAADGAG